MLCFAIINSVLDSLFCAGFGSGQSIVCFCQAGSTTTEHLLHAYSLHATTTEHLQQHTHHTRQQQNICCSILTTRDNNRTSAAAYPKHATTTEHLLQHTHHTRQQQNICCIHTHYKRQQRNICCSIPTTSDNNGTSAACIPTTCDNKYSSGYSSNRDEAIFGVRKVSQSMFWEHSPSSTNRVSDWLRAESSPVDEEEIKIKMDDGVARYFTCLEGNLFVDLWEVKPCLGDPEWDSS